jgi:hypothetical protein
MGIILIFAGMISLAITRVFINSHWGQGIKIGTISFGVALLCLGLGLQGKKRKMR